MPGPDLRRDRLIAFAEGLSQYILPRMNSGFTFIELPPVAASRRRYDLRSFVGILLFRKVIDSTITNMRIVQPAVGIPDQAQGRSHVMSVLVGSSKAGELHVNPEKEFLQASLDTASSIRSTEPEPPRQQLGDVVDRETACEFSRSFAPHPITDREYKIHVSRTSLSFVPEVIKVGRIEGDRHEGVFIVRTKPTPI